MVFWHNYFKEPDQIKTMKSFLLSIFGLAIILLLWGCPKPYRKLNHHARFPVQPANLTDVNSPYDDYNSILPETHFGKQLIFSSNRLTDGGDFDLVGENFHVTWFMETGELRVDNSYYWQKTDYVAMLLHQVSWEGNEFGPYTIGFDTVIDGVQKRINILMYSTNNNVNTYHEEFVVHESEDGGATGIIHGPYVMNNLTNPYYQQYISFYGPAVTNIDLWEMNPNLFTQMYFSKNEDGTSDIYRIKIPDSLNFMQFLTDSVEYTREIVPELNSPSNDNCPFVNGNMMVFTSDRPGGYGGYDLYYSFFDGVEWSEPVNFGETINSGYDEFRPVVVQVPGFENDVMIFSSDRPGGQGGFDLYYVGIDKIIPVTITEQ